MGFWSYLGEMWLFNKLFGHHGNKHQNPTHYTNSAPDYDGRHDCDCGNDCVRDWGVGAFDRDELDEYCNDNYDTCHDSYDDYGYHDSADDFDHDFDDFDDDF